MASFCSKLLTIVLVKKRFTITKYCDTPVMFGYAMAPGRSVAQVSSIIPNLCFLHVPNDVVAMKVRICALDRWRPQQLTTQFSLQDLQISTYQCLTLPSPCLLSSLPPVFPRSTPPREAVKLCKCHTPSCAKGHRNR